MLTKDLLKYSIRGDKVIPRYLKPGEYEHVALAQRLEALFLEHKGRPFCELQEVLKQDEQSRDLIFKGFVKLLEDRCDFEDFDLSFEAQRLDWFRQAKILRTHVTSTISAFQTSLSEVCQRSFAEIQDNLYGDLPDRRVVKEFKPFGSENLIHRYNLAQVQGLLLSSKKLVVNVSDKNLIHKRKIMQKMRFFRLLCDMSIKGGGDELCLEISGPLDLFESSQNYGVRLSNFLPYVVRLSGWSLEAQVVLRGRELSLQLDSKKGFQSHYDSFSGYIPDEFELFIEKFNALSEQSRGGWEARQGEAHLSLGDQDFCFPDFSMRHEEQGEKYVELFHRWHGGGLVKRLSRLVNSRSDKYQDLILGVSASLVKDKELKVLMEKAESAGLNLFEFKQIPSPRAILAHLNKVQV